MKHLKKLGPTFELRKKSAYAFASRVADMTTTLRGFLPLDLEICSLLINANSTWVVHRGCHACGSHGVKFFVAVAAKVEEWGDQHHH
jgi:hypothetical protein